jgi:hypothetical protein
MSVWHNAFNRLQRCHERREIVIGAFFDLTEAIITLRSLIRRAWITYRWETGQHDRDHPPNRAASYTRRAQ